jgi:hypothetical protein
MTNIGHWTIAPLRSYQGWRTYATGARQILRWLTSSFGQRVRAGVVVWETPKRYDAGMKLREIEREALGLSGRERADLVLSLMDTLADPEAEVSDEEVRRREAELEDGSVEPLLHDEFVRRVREERGR